MRMRLLKPRFRLIGKRFLAVELCEEPLKFRLGVDAVVVSTENELT